MKTFDQLTRQQKKDAIDMASYELIAHVSKGNLDVTLVNPASQARLEKILENGRKKESPRLITLHLLNDKPIREELDRLAMVAAHGSQYDDNGDAITKGTEDVDLVLN